MEVNGFRVVCSGRDEEKGTTLLETTIATALTLGLIMAVGGVAISGLRTVGFARQRNVANSLLSQAMEEIRALPFQTVANGLSNSDSTISTDANIAITGVAPNQTYTFTGTNEIIPHGSLSYTQVPLVPHLATSTLNSTTFTVGVYPTVWSGAAGVFRVTAIVSWSNTLGNGVPSKVSGQTLVYSPAGGCLSRGTHPFAAPCQPFFHGSATTGVGYVKIKAGNGYSGNAIQGIPLNLGLLSFSNTGTSVAIEQTSNILGVAKTSGVSLDVSGQPLQTAGVVSKSVAANNDPGNTLNTSNSSSLSQTGSSVTFTSGSRSITLTPSSADSGSQTATVSASTTPACNDLANVALVTSLPCGSSSLSQSGTPMTATAGFGDTPGTATLASIGAQPSSTNDFVARMTTSTGGYCSGTSGDGCVHAAIKRYFGTIAIAGLPAGITPPPGWGGTSCNNTNALIQVTGLIDQVVSESGVSAAAPSATQTAGTLTYWNGTGCTSQAINWAGSPPSITIPAVSVTTGTTTVSITTALTLGATSTSLSTPSGCTAACTGTAISQAPVSADIQYVVTDSTGTLGNLDINFTMGDAAATSSYQAAPAGS